MMAAGVASPIAHGQATTSTATVATSAAAIAGEGAKTSQATQVSAAIASTTVVKMPTTRSARRWIGSFEPCACSTIRTICASTVRVPTSRASTRSTPNWFIVPPTTRSPVRFATGTGSPLSIDSST